MIFPWKKQYTNSHVCLNVDIHSHLIPGIDDGAKDMDESILLLEGLAALGYKKVITTPHIMKDSYKNTRSTIKEGLQRLREEVRKRHIGIDVEAAAEYYLDDGFMSHIEAGNMLTFGENYLLFETSYIAQPLSFEVLVKAMIDAGYKPVLAHPERYRYIHTMKTAYQALKALGILFQLNSNSLGGYYGKEAQKKALYLSKMGMIDFLGSDIHHKKQIEMLQDVHLSATYQHVFAYNSILNDTI